MQPKEIFPLDPLRLLKKPYCSGLLTGECVKGFEHLDINSIPFDELAHKGIDQPFNLLKSTKSRCTVSFEFTTNGLTRVVYVKRYKVLRPLRRIGYLFVPSKSTREWKLGYSLIKRGIHTPLPVVRAEFKKGPFVIENYLVTLGIEPYQPVPDYLVQLENGEERNSFLASIALFVRSVHQAGFYHDDLGAHHIFCLPGQKGEMHFALIDLDNGRLLRSVPYRCRVKNLFQIFRSLDESSLSKEERMRFLKNYLEAAPSPSLLSRINALALRKTGRQVI